MLFQEKSSRRPPPSLPRDAGGGVVRRPVSGGGAAVVGVLGGRSRVGAAQQRLNNDLCFRLSRLQSGAVYLSVVTFFTFFMELEVGIHKTVCLHFFGWNHPTI